MNASPTLSRSESPASPSPVVPFGPDSSVHLPVSVPASLRSVRWVFTDFDASDLGKKRWLDLSPTSYKSLVIGIETCPTTGRVHLQGLVVFTHAKSLMACRRISPRAHWEPMRGTLEQAVEYCRKGGNMLVDVYQPSQQGRRSDLDAACAELSVGGIRAVAQLYPSTFVKYPAGFRELARLQSCAIDREVTVFVYWGPSGIGKSGYAMLEPDSFVLTPPATPRDKLWFDMYQGESVLIIDEFNGTIDFRLFLRILDRYRLSVEVKGGTVAARWSKVIITSNAHPRDWYANEPNVDPLRRRLGAGMPILADDWGPRLFTAAPFAWTGPRPSWCASSVVHDVDASVSV